MPDHVRIPQEDPIPQETHGSDLPNGVLVYNSVLCVDELYGCLLAYRYVSVEVSDQ